MQPMNQQPFSFTPPNTTESTEHLPTTLPLLVRDPEKNKISFTVERTGFNKTEPVFNKLYTYNNNI